MQASHFDKKFESPRWCGLFWGLSRLRHVGGRKEHKRLVFASLLSAKTLSRSTVLYGGQVVFKAFQFTVGLGIFHAGASRQLNRHTATPPAVMIGKGSSMCLTLVSFFASPPPAPPPPPPSPSPPPHPLPPSPFSFSVFLFFISLILPSPPLRVDMTCVVHLAVETSFFFHFYVSCIKYSFSHCLSF